MLRTFYTRDHYRKIITAQEYDNCVQNINTLHAESIIKINPEMKAEASERDMKIQNIKLINGHWSLYLRKCGTRAHNEVESNTWQDKCRI